MGCAAVCCSVLHCVAGVCCSVVQYVAVYTNFRYGYMMASEAGKMWGVLQCVAAWCSVLYECVAVCGSSVLQCCAICCSIYEL